MANGSGELKKLTITACTIQTNGDVKEGSQKFVAMLNPTSYSHRHVVSYDETVAFGKAGPTVKFSGVDGEEVDFDLLLDGTGVVEGATRSVKTQVTALKDVVYMYDGNNHEPNVVKLLWGSLIFFGRLKTMSVEYTVFEPGGDPLRAKVKLSFFGFMSAAEESLRAKRSSPDLSHSVVVQEGDTLPLLCHRVYKDARYYLEVARFNNLTDFRTLEPGSRISLPPLRSDAETPTTPSRSVRKYPRRKTTPRTSRH